MSSELIRAAQDVLRAGCRRHRERALRRLDAAVGKGDGERDLRHSLLLDMALVLKDYDDDPLAADLVARAVDLGVLPRDQSGSGDGKRAS